MILEDGTEHAVTFGQPLTLPLGADLDGDGLVDFQIEVDLGSTFKSVTVFLITVLDVRYPDPSRVRQAGDSRVYAGRIWQGRHQGGYQLGPTIDTRALMAGATRRSLLFAYTRSDGQQDFIV